jgi:hypothetical protein
MTSYNVCEDVKTLFMKIRVEALEIHLDTAIARWEEDIGSLPGSLLRRQQCRGGMIRTDLETTMAPL